MNSAPRPGDWIPEVKEKLTEFFIQGRGWGYSPEGVPCAEPTALACLALRANGAMGQKDSMVVEQGSRWLESLQQSTGSVGISEAISTPQWPTPYAILAWADKEAFREPAQRASAWLLNQAGSKIKDNEKIFGHDTTIAGWAWNAGTHSWLEPTAITVLALRRQNLAGHDRTREGLHLIMNRAIPSGGWNYGNNVVYGTELRPQPAPTGMALAALAGVHTMDSMISSACEYLESIVMNLRAPQSLCWALLGLGAWNRKPLVANQLLKASYEQILHRGAKPPQLSYLLLAAGDYSLDLLGIQSHKQKGSR